MKIAVLALQGAFIEHEKMLSKLGVDSFEIRQRKDIQSSFDGLIIPGGESTVQGKLLNELGLMIPIRQMIQEGLPVFGTCAGLLMLSKKIENGEPYLATMDIIAVRNAYGRQLGSFYTEESFGENDRIPMTFIRAPYILKAGENVTVLSSVQGKAVAARQENQLVTAFHPELNGNITVHKYFADMCI